MPQNYFQEEDLTAADYNFWKIMLIRSNILYTKKELKNLQYYCKKYLQITNDAKRNYEDERAYAKLNVLSVKFLLFLHCFFCCNY
jgi:hypothetical protein